MMNTLIPGSKWAAVRLGKIAEFKNGVNFTRDESGPEVKLVGVKDFQDYTQPQLESLESVRLSVALRPEDRLADDDLLFVRSNGSRELVGRCLIIKGLTEPVTHSGFTIRARLTSNCVLPDYLALFMQTAVARARLFRLGAGTNISNLSQSILSQVDVIYPPLAVQHHIVNGALHLTNAVSTVRMLIKAKKKLHSGLMDHLLFSNRHHPPLMHPKWQSFKLGTLFTERNETGREDLPLLSITSDRGVISRDEIERRDSSNEDKRAYKRICPGDIGYNTMRMWQGVSALSSLEGIVSPAYTICIPTTQIHGPFAAYLFKHPRVIHSFGRYSQGLVDDTLSLKFHHFAQIEVTIPVSKEQQRRIADILTAADTEISLLTHYSQLLKKQQQDLVEHLLNTSSGLSHGQRHGTRFDTVPGNVFVGAHHGSS